jgi:hypothetical protein
MLAVGVALAFPTRVPAQEERPETDPPRNLPPVLKAVDRRGNNDGRLQRNETPARLLPFFEQADADGDGVVTIEEVNQAQTIRRANRPRFLDVLGDLEPTTLDLLGGSLHPVGWDEGTLVDASRNRTLTYVVRYPTDLEGPLPIILISHGGFGSSSGQYGFIELATAYARLGFLTINLGHAPSANEVQHRYDRPLDVSFLLDALTRTRAANLRIPGGGNEAFPMPKDCPGTPDVDHVGLLGHSFGAFTAHAVAGAIWTPTQGVRNFRDPRIDAVVPISPQGALRFGGYDNGPDDNSWSEIRIPVYLICGSLESPTWRRQPFDRYPETGDKFLTIAKGQGHGIVNGDQSVQRLLALNTALFFHTYLRNGSGRDRIGTLAWIDGWTLERKPAPESTPDDQP